MKEGDGWSVVGRVFFRGRARRPARFSEACKMGRHCRLDCATESMQRAVSLVQTIGAKVPSDCQRDPIDPIANPVILDEKFMPLAARRGARTIHANIHTEY